MSVSANQPLRLRSLHLGIVLCSCATGGQSSAPAPVPPVRAVQQPSAVRRGLGAASVRDPEPTASTSAQGPAESREPARSVRKEPSRCRGLSYIGTPASEPGVEDPPWTQHVTERSARHQCSPGQALVEPEARWRTNRLQKYMPRLIGVPPQEWPEPPKAFCMDVHEVTNARYRGCIDEGGCPELVSEGCRSYGDDKPVLCASLAGARAFCASVGARLPTETERNYAAGLNHGTNEPFRYPWGHWGPIQGRTCWCRTSDQGPCVPGSSVQDVSLEGVRDLAGNAREWVVEPVGCAASDFSSYYMRGYNVSRPDEPPFDPQYCGFRCARDAQPLEGVHASPTQGTTDNQSP